MSAVSDFVQAHGWGAAEQTPITPDASARRYTRLHDGSRGAVLMEDPSGDVALFARIANYLTDIGLSAPGVLAQDDTHGWMLLEDLGDKLFARVCAVDPTKEAMLYAAAAEALLVLHKATPAPGLGVADPGQLAQMIAPVFEFYAPDVPVDDQAVLVAALEQAIARHAPEASVTVLRDFHAENLLWLPDRVGPARAGLLDFQDALVGHPAYDMISMLHDARRDVSPLAAKAAVDTYLEGSGQSEAAFRKAMAVLGLQRNLRILGIFARLAKVGGKPGYLALQPRVWQQIQVCLQEGAVSSLGPLVNRVLPAPKVAGQ